MQRRSTTTGWEWFSLTKRSRTREFDTSNDPVEMMKSSSSRVDVNMKYETYCNAISDGGEEEWDFAWKR